MSKQLYEEALADVKKLKEVAEDNAKRALLEAVTPRIKDLIENQLLGEAEFDPKKDDLLLDDPDQLAPEQVELPLTNSEESPVKSSDEDATVSKNEDVYELSVESARALGLLV